MAVSKNPSTRVTLFEVASGSGGLRMIPVFQLHLCGVHVLQPQFRRASSWCCWGGVLPSRGVGFLGLPSLLMTFPCVQEAAAAPGAFHIPLGP